VNGLERSHPRRAPQLYRARPRFFSADRGAWRDRAILFGVLALVILTPLPMGAVHPWSFIAAEIAIFGLFIVWMAKVALAEPIPHQPSFQRIAALAAPLALFIGFIAFQLLPLPPSLIRVASPATHRFYVHALDGWPATAPYQAMLELPEVKAPKVSLVLPTPNEVKEGLRVPEVHQSAKQAAEVAKARGAAADAPRWRPLSIAPGLTREIFFKVAAYAALFFVVLLYPFGPSIKGEAEKRFFKYVLVTILATGLLVACIGILERVFWNGKILWMFVPYDWGRPELEFLDRARGPFVDPDHFASYLNMVLPIAVAGVLFPTFITRRNSEPYRVFCAVVALVVSIGLLLSLSRAGWIGALVGVAALIFLSSFITREQRPTLLRLSWRVTVPACAVAFAIVLATSSVFVGEKGRREADLRLKETISQHQSLRFRVGVWRDSLPMVRDFPLFGSGIGAYQDIFPHYQNPPWSQNSVRETHNDYLELLIGGGVAGFGLLAWFFAALGRRLYLGLRALPPDVLAIAAALLSSLTAMGFQELFDFNLQIPANAILFVIVLAMVTRLIATARIEEPAAPRDRRRTYALCGGASAVAAAFALLTLTQPAIPYPYNLKQPKTPLQARAILLRHPGYSRAHYWMVEAMGPRLSPKLRAGELAEAVWLDPTNPYARDLYAQALVWSGMPKAAMEQVTKSVFASPSLPTHFYLEWRLIPWLSPEESAAVERGFKEAVAHDFTGAVWGLGAFYAAQQRYADEAELFNHEAAIDPDTQVSEALLVAAGEAYARAGDSKHAESALRRAAALDPTDPAPYRDLATEVFARRKDIAGARAAIAKGVAAGADPAVLYLALANAANTIGDAAAVESAMLAAAKADPSNFDTATLLGQLYSGQNRFDQAALWFRRAAQIRPDSAQAYFRLGVAEEDGYQYFAAGQDFSRALELAPHDKVIRQHCEEFRKRVAAGAPKDSPGGLLTNSTATTP
jgi:O-antigen ligase/Flp pilus assembly protein TadD